MPLLAAANAGVRIVASIHARHQRRFVGRPQSRVLLETGAFSVCSISRKHVHRGEKHPDVSLSSAKHWVQAGVTMCAAPFGGMAR